MKVVREGLRRLKRRNALIVGVALLISGAVAYGLSTTEPPGLVLFIGRFHPLIVHLPIGILMAALLMEGAAHYAGMQGLREANVFVLICAAVSAVLAVVAGLFLAREGGYDEATLFWHRWLGVGVAGGSAAAALLVALSRRHRGTAWRRAYQGVLVATACLLVMTGHLGGTLTHGPTYLTRHMPAPLASLLGRDAPGAVGSNRFVHVDSAYVYEDLVEPVLQRRCTSCHSASKTKGGLRLDTPEHLMEGGDGGAVVEAGAPEASELLRRVTLPLHHEDRMPPDGEEPLGVGETELIRWWIAEGASLERQVGGVDTRPDAVQTVLARRSRPQPKTGLYALDTAPADPSVVSEVEQATGLTIRPIADDTPFLQVSAPDAGATIGDEELQALQKVDRQVAWLDLNDTRITDAAMKTVGELPHLTRLHLQHSNVGDAGLKYLTGLEHLTYVNLYGTDVSDSGLEHLAALEELKTLYLWQTEVSPEAAARLTQRRPGLSVDTGASIRPPDSTASSTSSARDDVDAN